MRHMVLRLAGMLLLALGVLAYGQDPAQLSIMEIQGVEQFSLFSGQVVETSGVVTAVGSRGRQFWMQDPNGDGNDATSDGMLVSDRDFLTDETRPSVGDSIRIVGAIEEQQFGQALPLTRMVDVVALEVLSKGNTLPEPVALIDLPDTSFAQAIAFWESLEGMLVSVENGTVVAPTSRFGEYGLITEKDARAGSGYFPRTRHLILNNLGNNVVDYNPERILTDDTIGRNPSLRPGDRVRSLTGVVDYTFGAWKLQVIDSDIDSADLPAAPVARRLGNLGNVTVTTFNIENLFDAEDNPNKDDDRSNLSPEALDTKLAKLANAIQVELNLPHILIVEEAENEAVLDRLAARVNDAAGTNYVATSFETSDGRGIEVGFLYDADRVTAFGISRFSDSDPNVAAAFGPSSPSPGREPLMGTFGINGKTLTIIGNHFKSKRGDNPPYGIESLDDQPFSRVSEVQRKAQARVVRDAANRVLEADPQALLMVTGDLNDFAFGEPGEGTDHPVAILEGSGDEVPLVNLVNFVEAGDRYSFIFDGNSQVLDHMLLSPALLDLYVGVDFLHFNASFPASLSSDLSTTLRSSDHDPLEGRFQF